MVHERAIQHSTLKRFIERCRLEKGFQPEFVWINRSSREAKPYNMALKEQRLEQFLTSQNEFELGLVPASIGAVVFESFRAEEPIEIIVCDEIKKFSAFTDCKVDLIGHSQAWVSCEGAEWMQSLPISFRAEKVGRVVAGSDWVRLTEASLLTLLRAERFWCEATPQMKATEVFALAKAKCDFFDFLDEGGGTGFLLPSVAISIFLDIYDRGQLKHIASETRGLCFESIKMFDETLLEDFAEIPG